MTAQSVYNALLAEGWHEELLPAVRTISNILNRQKYRLRTLQKTKVEKNSRNKCYLQQRLENEYMGR
jgi:hypothetical protein